jgi:methionyl-tRNA synthetase
MINYEQFQSIEIKIGKILSAEKIPDTDKLLKLSVAMGEEVPRQIVSGIALYYPDPAVLIGRKCAFVANLEPRIIKSYESQGMILAVSTEDGKFSTLNVSEDIPEGTRVK